MVGSMHLLRLFDQLARSSPNARVAGERAKDVAEAYLGGEAMFTDNQIEAALKAYNDRDRVFRGLRERIRYVLEAADREAWQPIATAPTDGSVVLVYVEAYFELSPFITVASYHPDAGWCVDDLRKAVSWRPLPHHE